MNSRTIPEGQTTQDLSGIKQTIQMLNNAKDPEAMLQYLMTSNPQFKEALNFARQNGGSYKDAFFALAKQKGADPGEIIALLR